MYVACMHAINTLLTELSFITVPCINFTQLEQCVSFSFVFDGLFGLANRLFGVDIVLMDCEKEGINVWCEDVSCYKIFDEQTGTEVAGFLFGQVSFF